MPMLSLIVAAADNRVIGRQGELPWHIPEDLKHFKRLTLGKPVVMGRKTFESIGRPLPGRRNIVATRQPGWRAAGVETAPSLDEALAMAGDAEEIMVIGGAQIYAQALPKADRIYLTEVHAEPAGDAYFPELEPGLWQEAAREDRPAQNGRPPYSFVTLARRR